MSTFAVSGRSRSFRVPLALAGAVIFDATKILNAADGVCRYYRCAEAPARLLPTASRVPAHVR